MRRRELILGLGGALIAPAAAHAQESTPVVGILDARGTNRLLLEQLRKGLAETGYREGQNVALRYVGADGHYDRLPALAADLTRAGVGVIVALSWSSIRAAQAATKSIPVVFMLGDDPVKHGLVASFNKPGGNVTGLSMLGTGLDAKRLQILHELVPDTVRVGLIVNPDNATIQNQIDEVQAAALAVGWKVDIARARSEPEIEAAFAALAKLQIGGVLVGGDPFFTSQHEKIAGLARQYRMPAVYEWRDFAESGGLASFGSSRADDYRLLGVYAGKIIAGAKPADLPVMQPTKFELIVNLKTAKALGLTVPQLLLAQADEVIE